MRIPSQRNALSQKQTRTREASVLEKMQAIPVPFVEMESQHATVDPAGQSVAA